MKPAIQFTRIWSDDDMLELRASACDGMSMFSIDTYVGIDWPDETVKMLTRFREQIHGGIAELELGSFGPEYASGAFFARLHFHMPGKLFISVALQSDFQKYKNTEVASEAKLYVRSEPILLDRFIEELARLKVSDNSVASLECI